MIVYAGAFKLLTDENGYSWYGYEPLANIEVEYSAYGKNDWSALDISENPEKFFMPGCGECYEANLASVNQKSATGWFDLRISIRDSTGNHQTQTISPAFKIEELAGVETIGIGESAADGRFYNLKGQEILNPEPGQIVIKISGNSSSKIRI